MNHEATIRVVVALASSSLLDPDNQVGRGMTNQPIKVRYNGEIKGGGADDRAMNLRGLRLGFGSPSLFSFARGTSNFFLPFFLLITPKSMNRSVD